MKPDITITIAGNAGAGKSTIGKQIKKMLSDLNLTAEYDDLEGGFITTVDEQAARLESLVLKDTKIRIVETQVLRANGA